MNEQKSDFNILYSNPADYASFLGKRFNEFERISESGYGLYWFPQCFYLYWQETKRIDNLELCGNMGPHYSSLKTSQFSEVIVSKNHVEYQSNIFILLPFKIFLIRFNRSEESEKDPNGFDPDILFTGIDWKTSFRANLWERSHSVSIGVLENLF